MNKINLSLLAEHLPTSWRSSILGQTAGANIKVLRSEVVCWRRPQGPNAFSCVAMGCQSE